MRAGEQHFTAAALSLAGETPAEILDAGCGHAWLRPIMGKAGHQYLGLDLDSEHADVEASVASMPFDDERFDVVLCRSVLQYLPRPSEGLDEFHRVLRPGGRLLCSVPFLEPWIWGSLIHFSPLGIVTLARQAGFEVTHLWPLWSGEEAMAEAAARLGGHASVSVDGVPKEARICFAACLMVAGRKLGA